jgi:hypothetical protein
MTATDTQVDTLAELLSWTSGEFTRYSPDAHPDHNRWSWRGDGHGGKVRDEFRAQARLLLGEGVAVGVVGRVGSFEGARSDEQGEEAPVSIESAEGAQIGSECESGCVVRFADARCIACGHDTVDLWIDSEDSASGAREGGKA